MIKRKDGIKFVFIISSFLVGCIPASAEKSTNVESTSQVLPTQTSYPTNTPYPTFTPFPSLTPTRTAIPTGEYKHWTSSQILQSIEDAGLNAELPVINSHTSDSLLEESAMFYALSRFKKSYDAPECIAYIWVYRNREDLIADREYMDALFESKNVQDIEWMFIKDNFVLTICDILPEEVARKYEKAILNIQ